MPSDCNDSISIQFVINNWSSPAGPKYYAIIAPSFICSVLGVILDIVFICRKKTNLLIRLFVYLMVSSTIELGSACLHNIIWILVSKQCFGYAIDLFSIISSYCFCMEAVTVCFINVMLMTQIFNYMCAIRSRLTCVSCWRNQINSHQKCMKAIFVTVLFGLPILITIIYYVLLLLLSLSDYGYHPGLLTILSCLQFLIVIPLILNLLCNVALLVWFCWLRRRGVAGVISRKVLKELALFFLLLFATLLYWVFIILPHLVELAIFIAILPYLLLLYMWLSFRRSMRQVRITHGENRNLHINPRTTGLETAPQSTRVSLPTDTADHAPNFLSPSGDETTEVTSLLN